MGGFSMSPKRYSRLAKPCFFREIGAEFYHLLGVVDGDDFLRTFRQELQRVPLARAEVGDDDGRHEGKEHLRYALQGAARTVGAAELSAS